MTEMASFVFTSYARADTPFVLRLASDLRAAGITLWIDQLDIPKGAIWDQEVERALRACTHVLVVLSPASVNSHNVMDEVSFGVEEGKSLIPLLYETCDRPFRLRRYQYVDFTGDYDNALSVLTSVLPCQSPALPPKVPEETDGPIPSTEVDLSRPADSAPPHLQQRCDPGSDAHERAIRWLSEGRQLHDEAPAEMVILIRKAAEVGLAEAQLDLFQLSCMSSDYGISDEEAVSWLRRAAEQRNPEAQYDLAELHKNGLFVIKDDGEAVRWYRAAALAGHEKAQKVLKKRGLSW